MTPAILCHSVAYEILSNKYNVNKMGFFICLLIMKFLCYCFADKLQVYLLLCNIVYVVHCAFFSQLFAEKWINYEKERKKNFAHISCS